MSISYQPASPSTAVFFFFFSDPEREQWECELTVAYSLAV